MAAPRRAADPDRLRGVLDNHNLEFRVSGSSYLFTCPLCNKADKLAMYRDHGDRTGRFKCWSCAESRGFAGAPEYAIAELTGLPVPQIREEIYGVGAVHVGRILDISFGEDEDWEAPDAVDERPLPQEQEWPMLFCRLDESGGEDGAAYLERRGVPRDVAVQYDIRYAPMRRSVVFPAIVGGKLYGWQYRIIDREVEVLPDGRVFKRLKSINENLPRESVVMFADRLIGAPHAVVAEGGIDALKCHLVGGNVATMGKAVADAQIALLLRSGARVVYSILDPDALPEVTRLVRRLGDDVEFHNVVVPRPYKDVGAMRMEDVPDLVLNSPIMRPGRTLPVWFPDRRVG